jgi:hypothetical protein
MRQLNWPTAFTLVFGDLPLVVYGVAGLRVYPAVMLPVPAIGTSAVCHARRQTRRTALAARAAADYQHAAALVSAPLPDMPTVPLRWAVRRQRR